MQQRAIARKLFVEHVVVESVQKTKIVEKQALRGSREAVMDRYFIGSLVE